MTTEEVKVEGMAACALGLLQNYCPATELVSLPPPPLAPLPPRHSPFYGGRLQVTMMEGNEQRACTLLTPRRPCDDEVILLCL